MTPQTHQNRKKQRKLNSILLLLLLLSVATLIWILNIENIIAGRWSDIISVLFAFFGLVLPLLQWHEQSVLENSSNPVASSLDQLEETSSMLGVNRRKGAIIIYTNRKLQGKTIHLASCSSGSNICIYSTSNVVKRLDKGYTCFSSIFPSIQPGHYYAILQSQQLISEVTVRTNHISEIDWR